MIDRCLKLFFLLVNLGSDNINKESFGDPGRIVGVRYVCDEEGGEAKCYWQY